MATVRDRPSKSLTVYAEELRQWLQLTRQVHAANQAMMQMHYQMLSRPAHPQTQTSGYSQDSADSTHPAGSRRPTTESNVPRTFPMSAGELTVRALLLQCIMYYHYEYDSAIELTADSEKLASR